MTLTKADIVDVLVEEQHLNQKNAKDFVDAFFNELVSTLENGYDIKLSGFGNAIQLWERGGLADIAPTILHLLGLPKPNAMTGSSLIEAIETSSTSSRLPQTV